MVVILLRWPHPIGMSEFQAQCLLVIPGGSVEDQDFNGLWKTLANECLKLVVGALEEVLTTFPFGLFGGVILSAQFIGLYHCSSEKDIVTTISMYYMSQQLGIALGISLSSGLQKHQLKLTLKKLMMDIPGSAEVSSTLYFPQKSNTTLIM